MESSANTSVQKTEPGSALCTKCGLCCSNILFNRAVLREKELQKAAELNLSVIQINNNYWFRLPCPHYGNLKCTIYPNRFKICDEFHCELLKHYLQKEISLESALHIVASAQDLVQKIQAQIPNYEDSRYLWDQINDTPDIQETNNSIELRRDKAGLLLNIFSLRVLFKKHFYRASPTEVAE